MSRACLVPDIMFISKYTFQLFQLLCKSIYNYVTTLLHWYAIVIDVCKTQMEMFSIKNISLQMIYMLKALYCFIYHIVLIDPKVSIVRLYIVI